MADIPHYYSSRTGDIYDEEVELWGLNAWCAHAEMEMLQYIKRARRKGDYRGDIEKIRVICARILYETRDGRDALLHSTEQDNGEVADRATE